jgi:hypothetical protein
MVNDAPFDIKAFKTLNLEGNSAWSATVNTNLTNGTLVADEFVEKEGEWYAYLRRSEDNSDYSSLAVQGIGHLTNRSSDTLFFNVQVNPSIAIGDDVYWFDGASLQYIGEVVDYDEDSIQTTSFAVIPAVGDLIVFSKDVRAEGSMIRGYYMQVTLENNNATLVELFAANTEAFKSFE